jgi:hypothetical protein
MTAMRLRLGIVADGSEFRLICVNLALTAGI